MWIFWYLEPYFYKMLGEMKAGFSLEILLQRNLIKMKSYCVAWKSFSFLKRKITLPVFDQWQIYKNEM